MGQLFSAIHTTDWGSQPGLEAPKKPWLHVRYFIRDGSKHWGLIGWLNCFLFMVQMDSCTYLVICFCVAFSSTWCLLQSLSSWPLSGVGYVGLLSRQGEKRESRRSQDLEGPGPEQHNDTSFMPFLSKQAVRLFQIQKWASRLHLFVGGGTCVDRNERSC